MILNYIWVSFFLLAFAVGVVKLIFFQDMQVFPDMFNSTFDMAPRSSSFATRTHEVDACSANLCIVVFTL